jgi:deoxycytidylate deaminase
MMNNFPRMPAGNTHSAGTKHSRYMNVLSKIASDIECPVGGNARLAACIVYRNDIVSFGVNMMKSHPFQAKYGKNPDSVFLHAETCAIKNALKYISEDELRKSTMYICRVKFYDAERKNLVFGLSRPCAGCFRCINTFNIRKVVYSLDNEGYDLL